MAACMWLQAHLCVVVLCMMAPQDIPELAKEPRCLPALLSVLRCGTGSCVAACQHLAAALLWTAAADPAVVGLLGEIDGVTDTLLNSLSPQLDSGIRVRPSAFPPPATLFPSVANTFAPCHRGMVCGM